MLRKNIRQAGQLSSSKPCTFTLVQYLCGYLRWERRNETHSIPDSRHRHTLPYLLTFRQQRKKLWLWFCGRRHDSRVRARSTLVWFISMANSSRAWRLLVLSRFISRAPLTEIASSKGGRRALWRQVTPSKTTADKQKKTAQVVTNILRTTEPFWQAFNDLDGVFSLKG